MISPCAAHSLVPRKASCFPVFMAFFHPLCLSVTHRGALSCYVKRYCESLCDACNFTPTSVMHSECSVPTARTDYNVVSSVVQSEQPEAMLGKPTISAAHVPCPIIRLLLCGSGQSMRGLLLIDDYSLTKKHLIYDRVQDSFMSIEELHVSTGRRQTRCPTS